MSGTELNFLSPQLSGDRPAQVIADMRRTDPKFDATMAYLVQIKAQLRRIRSGTQDPDPSGEVDLRPPCTYVSPGGTACRLRRDGHWHE